jgi:hypothetical protein
MCKRPAKRLVMNHFLVCENPDCRFILDRRVNGGSLDGVRKIVKECPACGSNWSSLCPFCDRALTVNCVRGLPHAACCGRRLCAEARAA